MLPKVNYADMVGRTESHEKYLRSHHGDIRASLAYIIKKTTIVQVYSDLPKHATPDDEMIARMLHLHPGKNKLHNEQVAQSIIKHMAEYEIDNKSVCDILY